MIPEWPPLPAESLGALLLPQSTWPRAGPGKFYKDWCCCSAERASSFKLLLNCFLYPFLLFELFLTWIWMHPMLSSCPTRCFFIAQSYVLVKKWSEALVLYDRVLKYANEVQAQAGTYKNSLKVWHSPFSREQLCQWKLLNDRVQLARGHVYTFLTGSLTAEQ